MRLILLGPPGAGKGTQAVILAKRYNVPHISTGDIFRELIKNKSQLGLKIKKYVDTGELIPDSVVVEVVASEIKNTDFKKGFILDGFPRTLPQARMLDDTLKNLGVSIDKVFYFDTSEDIIIKRLTGRRICRNCGTNYHLVNMPPKKNGICDLCGGELYQRKDDEPETIHNRLRVYQEQTLDLISYYKNRGILETVNGDLSKDETFGIIETLLSRAG